jgi:peptidoglycan/xylan/chitin deacetylase (PgdA/CDA1 family)
MPRFLRWGLAAVALVAVAAYRLGVAMGQAVSRPAPVVTAVPITEKALALTFDDGPTPRWTPQILGLLREAHAQATFFVIGKQVLRYPHLVAEEVRAGMEIGNHGSAHLILRRRPPSVLRAEIEEGAQAIEAAGAPPPRLYRLPAGVYDRTALDVLGSLGYTVVGWSIDPRDWRRRFTAGEMARLVETEAAPGSIVIFHDGTNGSAATVEAVRLILQDLGRQGYRFVTVSRLLALVRSRL